MMRRTENLKAKLFSLSFFDRTALLTLSIIENETEARGAINGLIELVIRMAVNFDIENRIKFAERLRDAADTIEPNVDDEARWLTEKTR